MIRDAFINGVASSFIRHHLLQDKTLHVDTAYTQAYALDSAQRNAESYASATSVARTAALASEAQQQRDEEQQQSAAEKLQKIPHGDGGLGPYEEMPLPW